VAAAWKCFQNGYRQYPYSAMVGYYGPCHDGPVWPLYLIPRDLPLAPTWQINHGLSGDRIGEMICYTHTAKEFQVLFTQMSQAWNRGLKRLESLPVIHQKDPERRRDLGVAEALGVQFESAKNILNFYLEREELPFQPPTVQRRTICNLKKIVRRELELDTCLLKLARTDSRLGFHSEAEAYKYYPQLIQWRMRQLNRLLKTEFPRVEADIAKHQPLFPLYTGKQLEGPVYHCRRFRSAPTLNGRPVGAQWENLPEATCRWVMSPHDSWVKPLPETEHHERQTTWQAGYDQRHLYVGIRCREPDMARLRNTHDQRNHIPYPYWNNDCAGILIEPRRLWPNQILLANAAGARWQCWPSRHGEPWRVSTWRGQDEWSLIFRIPLAFLREESQLDRPMRVDVIRAVPRPDLLNGERLIRWMEARHPQPYRLAFRRDNPADLGWLVFDHPEE
jgi:hypothetical protein